MRVLIPAYTGLGNFILKTPLIQTLHKLHSDIKIDIVYGNSWGVENVLKDSKLIDLQIKISNNVNLLQQMLLMKRQLKRQPYDLILLPFDSTPLYMYMVLLIERKASVVAHYRRLSSVNSFFQKILAILIPRIQWVTTLKNRHEIDLNIDLLAEFEKKPFNYSKKTLVFWEKTEIVSEKIQGKYVALQIGANNGEPTPKTWSLKNFIELVKIFKSANPDYFIVLVGDNGDSEYLKRSNLLFESDVINLLGHTSFDELCDVIKGASLVIAHDSGVMHVANSMSVPLISLYGPTDYKRTMPLSDSSSVLISEKCKDEMYDMRISEKKIVERYGDYYCLSGISVNDVYVVAQDKVNYG